MPKVESLPPIMNNINLYHSSKKNNCCLLGFLFVWISVIFYPFPSDNLSQEDFAPEILLKIVVKFLNEIKPERLNAQTTR